MPLLNIYGLFDHLVPPEACERLTRAVGSEDTEDICLRTGHIGIYVSSKCQRDFAPKIAAWLAERDEQRKRPRRPAKKRPPKRAARKTAAAAKQPSPA
jgi:polyhydroxyalkanoate synthase